MDREDRIFGPPGTGKTTFLSRQISNAVEKHGAENVMVASYTRAAAFELVQRNLPVPKENIGTLHSLCYRAMDRPDIAEVRVKEFNEQFPHFAVTTQSVSLDEGFAEYYTEGGEGDFYLNIYNNCRSMMIPIEKMPPRIQGFVNVWERWKLKHDLVDFTDMIAYTLQGKLPPPGEPTIGIYDEAQDFSRLQLALIRHWAKFQEHILLAGDDDQCIYSFVGATPDAFLDPPVPEDQKRVLNQSWRVPRLVQDMAEKWIRNVSRRETKNYNPRNEDGFISRINNANFKHPERLIENAMKTVSNGKTIMILATCGYMLNEIKTILRTSGVPFHNPYRKSRGDWNPLNTAPKGKTSTKDRLIAFFEKEGGRETPEGTYWTDEQLELWVPMMKTDKLFVKNGKRQLIEWIEVGRSLSTTHDVRGEFLKYFTPEGLNLALKRDPDWFLNSVLSARASALEFPMRVFKAKGKEGLTEKPQVILSTIHGVKGGEADVVYLMPDLSLAGMRDWKGGDSTKKDAIVRTFYVGMTRAREGLVMCSPASRLCVPI